MRKFLWDVRFEHPVEDTMYLCTGFFIIITKLGTI